MRMDWQTTIALASTMIAAGSASAARFVTIPPVSAAAPSASPAPRGAAGATWHCQGHPQTLDIGHQSAMRQIWGAATTNVELSQFVNYVSCVYCVYCVYCWIES